MSSDQRRYDGLWTNAYIL